MNSWTTIYLTKQRFHNSPAAKQQQHDELCCSLISFAADGQKEDDFDILMT
jgi:hypothetical protein